MNRPHGTDDPGLANAVKHPLEPFGHQRRTRGHELGVGGFTIQLHLAEVRMHQRETVPGKHTRDHRPAARVHSNRKDGKRTAA